MIQFAGQHVLARRSGDRIFEIVFRLIAGPTCQCPRPSVRVHTNSETNAYSTPRASARFLTSSWKKPLPTAGGASPQAWLEASGCSCASSLRNATVRLPPRLSRQRCRGPTRPTPSLASGLESMTAKCPKTAPDRSRPVPRSNSRRRYPESIVRADRAAGVSSNGITLRFRTVSQGPRAGTSNGGSGGPCPSGPANGRSGRLSLSSEI